MGFLSNLTQYNKSIIALVMALGTVLVNFGVVSELPGFLTEANLTTFFALLGTVLVYFVPNTPAET